MKIQHLICEAVDEKAVASWMEKYGIRNYELFDDGSVSFSGSDIPEISLGDPRFPLPFNAIRKFGGSITIGCYSGTSSRFDKFLQRADYGTVTIKLYGEAPILSFCRLKGNSRIVVQITGRRPNGTTGRLMDVESTIMQGISYVRDGLLDIHEFQEQLIDAGMKGYAKL